MNPCGLHLYYQVVWQSKSRSPTPHSWCRGPSALPIYILGCVRDLLSLARVWSSCGHQCHCRRAWGGSWVGSWHPSSVQPSSRVNPSVCCFLYSAPLGGSLCPGSPATLVRKAAQKMFCALGKQMLCRRTESSIWSGEMKAPVLLCLSKQRETHRFQATQFIVISFMWFLWSSGHQWNRHQENRDSVGDKQ